MSQKSRRRRPARRPLATPTRRPRIEFLEARQMLAADAFALDTDQPVAEGEGPIAEGESVPLSDLEDFAQALTDAGVKFFGSSTCPVCARQKSLFGSKSGYDCRTFSRTGPQNPQGRTVRQKPFNTSSLSGGVARQTTTETIALTGAVTKKA